jgi:hypothetical protein
MLSRSLLVSEVAKIIVSKGYSENDALEIYYNSPISDAVFDEDTGLYGQSAQYVAGLVLENGLGDYTDGYTDSYTDSYTE